MSGRRQALLCGITVALLAVTGCTGGDKKIEVSTRDAFTAAVDAMRQAPAVQYTSEVGAWRSPRARPASGSL
ncbi:hypothetical protein ACGFII_31240 [Micromonospora chalcea]